MVDLLSLIPCTTNTYLISLYVSDCVHSHCVCVLMYPLCLSQIFSYLLCSSCVCHCVIYIHSINYYCACTIIHDCGMPFTLCSLILSLCVSIPLLMSRWLMLSNSTPLHIHTQRNRHTHTHIPIPIHSMCGVAAVVMVTHRRWVDIP